MTPKNSIESMTCEGGAERNIEKAERNIEKAERNIEVSGTQHRSYGARRNNGKSPHGAGFAEGRRQA